MKRFGLILLMLLLLPAAAFAAEAGSFRLDYFQGGAMGMRFLDITVDEGGAQLSLWANDAVTDFTLEQLDWFAPEAPAVTARYAAAELPAKHGLNITAELPEVLPTLRVRCIGADGTPECWYIACSGEDGAMLLLSAEDCGLPFDDDFNFAELADAEFVFSSGAGAWHTLGRVDESGLMTCEFTDADMGSTDDGFPGGTLYYCAFDVRLADPVRVNDFSWLLRAEDLTVDNDRFVTDPTAGVRYVPSTPYGLENAGTLLLYRPGTPVSLLTEDAASWLDRPWDSELKTLPYWVLYNPADGAAFCGWTAVE